jgi:hypothetical protein
MANVPEMTTDFARWYAEAFMDESETRNLRWKGVVDVTANADHLTAEVLTRLAFQTPVPASGRKNEDIGEAYSSVISVIAGGGATFEATQSTRELQILAAAALVRLVVTLPDAGLTVTTASFGGYRKPDLPMDLVGLAENALIALSGRKHSRIGIDKLKIAAPKLDFSVAPEALQSMVPDQWKAQFDHLRDATATAIGRIVEGQNRAVELLHRQVSLDAEELQMLWWLLGGYSKLVDKPFQDIEAAIKPLVLAHELGEMTEVSPGPASIRAMLFKAGVGTDQLKVGEVVNAVDLGWAKSISTSKLISPVTTPIHFALEQRTELGSSDAWQAGWSGLTGLSPDASLPAIVFAELFYREHIFINVSA